MRQAGRHFTQCDQALLTRGLVLQGVVTRLASLLDALPGGVVIVDSTGKITESNPQAERLLGEPLEGEDWSAVEARGYYPDETTLEIHLSLIHI